MISSFKKNEKKKNTHETRPTNFSKIIRTGLQFDIDECEFFIQKIKYLNPIITPKNIKMEKKISAIFDRSTAKI